MKKICTCRRTHGAHISAGMARSAKSSLLALAFVIGGTGTGAALATEGGGNSYPVGVETNNPGVMLPEGLHLLAYYTHYSASHAKDNSGNDNARFAYYKLRADAVSVRFSYVWPRVRWFGANVETRAVLGLPNVDLSLGIARPAPLAPLDRSGERTGFSDLAFAPIVLGWHGPHLHQTVGIETYLPSGAYDVSRPVNTGRNYYQIAPAYALTWKPNDNVDLNVKLRYAFNGRNKDTDYRSGNEFTTEYSAGYRFSPAIAAGLSGYMYRQTTDDTLAGAAVNGNGNRGFVNAIGPYVSMTVAPKVTILAKVQSEFGARNRAEGTRFWLQARLPF